MNPSSRGSDGAGTAASRDTAAPSGASATSVTASSTSGSDPLCWKGIDMNDVSAAIGIGPVAIGPRCPFFSAPFVPFTPPRRSPCSTSAPLTPLIVGTRPNDMKSFTSIGDTTGATGASGSCSGSVVSATASAGSSRSTRGTTAGAPSTTPADESCPSAIPTPSSDSASAASHPFVPVTPATVDGIRPNPMNTNGGAAG